MTVPYSEIPSLRHHKTGGDVGMHQLRGKSQVKKKMYLGFRKDHTTIAPIDILR